MADPLRNDAVAFIRIDLYADGAMSIQGNIGDAALATRMLDHARDAVRSNFASRPKLVIPNRDVVTPDPVYPIIARGDLAPKDRGEL